jgi:CBS domain-containing protein
MIAHRITSIMRRDVQTLALGTPIRQAISIMLDARAAAAPVLGENGQLAGILTQKDCFRPALLASYHQEWTGRVADQMSPNVVTVDASDDVIRVAEMFLSHSHRVFPVMEGTQVLGMAHRSDVLTYMLREG